METCGQETDEYNREIVTGYHRAYYYVSLSLYNRHINVTRNYTCLLSEQPHVYHVDDSFG